MKSAQSVSCGVLVAVLFQISAQSFIWLQQQQKRVQVPAVILLTLRVKSHNKFTELPTDRRYELLLRAADGTGTAASTNCSTHSKCSERNMSAVFVAPE